MTRPLPPLARARALCAAIYGEPQAEEAFARLSRVIAAYPSIKPRLGDDLTERDVLLITYGDQVQDPDQPPLQTLNCFCARYLTGVVSTIHLLPFHPSTSDDGFAVADYRAVNPEWGSWDDIAQLGARFRLMFDAVVNHVSSQHPWFQAYLRGEPPYLDYFITVEGEPDLSQVVRPRALPLLTRFDTALGQRKVWTTFSADQIDLNYANPIVLAEMVDLLLFYAQRGADFIRLDAVAYLWKAIGTPCIHLPNTHRIVRLFRAALDAVAPQVRLITETNVSHAENVAYFGNGQDEAQLVYNFALPPLVLHALQTGDARAITQWAGSLALPSKRVTFLNFLASHDGIGLNAARGISERARDRRPGRAHARAGRPGEREIQQRRLAQPLRAEHQLLRRAVRRPRRMRRPASNASWRRTRSCARWSACRRCTFIVCLARAAGRRACSSAATTAPSIGKSWRARRWRTNWPMGRRGGHRSSAGWPSCCAPERPAQPSTPSATSAPSTPGRRSLPCCAARPTATAGCSAW
jgi:hypothetical protein